MENKKRQFEATNRHYCEWYNRPQEERIRCPYLERGDKYCNKYKSDLVAEDLTDSWTGRDVWCVARCEDCKND